MSDEVKRYWAVDSDEVARALDKQRFVVSADDHAREKERAEAAEATVAAQRTHRCHCGGDVVQQHATHTIGGCFAPGPRVESEDMQLLVNRLAQAPHGAPYRAAQDAILAAHREVVERNSRLTARNITRTEEINALKADRDRLAGVVEAVSQEIEGLTGYTDYVFARAIRAALATPAKQPLPTCPRCGSIRLSSMFEGCQPSRGQEPHLWHQGSSVKRPMRDINTALASGGGERREGQRRINPQCGKCGRRTESDRRKS